MAVNFDKYLYSTGTHYISNSGSDEKGGTKGGQAGDQTGKEWQLKPWYKRPWTVVLRYPNQAVALEIAKLGIAAALNNKVGYDQSQRATYWTQLKAVGYDPSQIVTPCEEDCTAGVTANVKACGYIFGIPALQELNASSTRSSNMRSRFVKAGFKALTASKYLTSGNYLLPGDILLYENHHAATNITLGKYVNGEWHPGDAPAIKTDYDLGERTLRNGDTGTDVKELQQDLIQLGFDCGKYGADGDFGDATEIAVKDFQRSFGLDADGVFGSESYKTLCKAMDAMDKPTGDAYVLIVGGNCYVRTGPSTGCEAIGVAYEDSKWPFAGLVNDENDWLMIDYKGRDGWVSPKYGRLVE